MPPKFLRICSDVFISWWYWKLVTPPASNGLLHNSKTLYFESEESRKNTLSLLYFLLQTMSNHSVSVWLTIIFIRFTRFKWGAMRKLSDGRILRDRQNSKPDWELMRAGAEFCYSLPTSNIGPWLFIRQIIATVCQSKGQRRINQQEYESQIEKLNKIPRCCY